MSELSPRDKLAAARTLASFRAWYLTQILFSLMPVEAKIGTLAVDKGLRLYFDPDEVNKWEVPAIATVLEHECYHILRNDLERKQDRDPIRWNIAADAAINDDLYKLKYKWPIKDYIIPKMLGLKDGETAEFYYENMKVKVKECCCGGISGNPGEWEKVDKDGKDSQGNQVIKGELPPALPGSEVESIRRNVAETCKTAGNIPQHLRVWANDFLTPPRIPWRKLLMMRVKASLFTAAGASDYTYKRPSRRSEGLRRIWPNAPIMPSMHHPLPRVSLVVDTSGSMYGESIKLAFSEILGVVRALGCPVKVYATDAAVEAIANVGSVKDLDKIDFGGGGTDMGIGMKEASKDKPDLIVVLTDGYTGWPTPEEVNPKKIIVALTTTQKVPEYYNVVRIDD